MRLGSSLYVLAALLVLATDRAPGQGGTAPGNHDHAAQAAMAARMVESAHLRMTPLRDRTIADSVRAMAIADTLRAALARYADPAAAERDGFKRFAPQLKNLPVYHYTSRRNALREAFRFDPRRPTSILYSRDSTGQLRLVGAMYTMPRRASPAALEKRIPLSVAQWHLHTNLCAPKNGQEQRWFESKDGKPLFGLAGTITTEAACAEKNGRFHSVIFGWMVHANVFEGTDLKAVWGHGDAKGHAGHEKP